MPEIKGCWIRRGRKTRAVTFTSVLHSLQGWLLSRLFFAVWDVSSVWKLTLLRVVEVQRSDFWLIPRFTAWPGQGSSYFYLDTYFLKDMCFPLRELLNIFSARLQQWRTDGWMDLKEKLAFTDMMCIFLINWWITGHSGKVFTSFKSHFQYWRSPSVLCNS